MVGNKKIPFFLSNKKELHTFAAEMMRVAYRRDDIKLRNRQFIETVGPVGLTVSAFLSFPVNKINS